MVTADNTPSPGGLLQDIGGVSGRPPSGSRLGGDVPSLWQGDWNIALSLRDERPAGPREHNREVCGVGPATLPEMPPCAIQPFGHCSMSNVGVKKTVPEMDPSICSTRDAVTHDAEIGRVLTTRSGRSGSANERPQSGATRSFQFTDRTSGSFSGKCTTHLCVRPFTRCVTQAMLAP